MAEMMASDVDGRAVGKVPFNPTGTSKMGQMNPTLRFSTKPPPHLKGQEMSSIPGRFLEDIGKLQT